MHSLRIQTYFNVNPGLLTGEVVDVRKEYEMLAKLNLVNEKKVNDIIALNFDDENIDV